MYCFCFFFFKQKTAYEMRISDWSSDVCSSDLADPPAQGQLVDGADILAVDGDAAAGDVVEAVEQPRQGRLAGAGCADHGDLLARRDPEADAFQDLAARVIGEMHVVEHHLAGDRKSTRLNSSH